MTTEEMIEVLEAAQRDGREVRVKWFIRCNSPGGSHHMEAIGTVRDVRALASGTELLDMSVRPHGAYLGSLPLSALTSVEVL